MGFNTDIIEAFKNSFENKCITLLVAAYQSSITNSDYSLGWMENDFTSMLNNYITKNINRITWQISNNREDYQYNESTKKKRGFADKESRIDFKFSTFESNKEFITYFEAKLLKENDNGIHKRYVKTGIDNFISGKYPRGIMIGYLVEGNVDKTIKKVCDILCKNKRSSEVLSMKPSLYHNHYYESNHSGFGIIKHLIFDFVFKSPCF